MEHAHVALPAIPVFQDLYLCTAGRSVCCPGHSFGPDVRINYLIHYILSGKGVYETNESQYHLSKGQGFLIEPGHTTRYCADQEQPWTYIWVGFNGSLASALLSNLGLNQKHPVFSCQESGQLEEIARQLLLPAHSDTQLSLNQQALLLSFFQILASQSLSAPPASDLRTNYHIEKALEFVRANYFRQIHVADIARHLGISRFHLHNLFVNTIGQTPQEYLTGFCLGRAREYLTTTNYSVSEIAFMCGYSNSDVFAKAFKRKYLASPSRYRRFALEHPGQNPSDHMGD